MAATVALWHETRKDTHGFLETERGLTLEDSARYFASVHTHQQNAKARQLYEKHGFEAVRFGVSPPPESAPDVEYHWRPDRR